ncbi:MAG: D-isomer specific 2-hydroxyacid dehydrogenase family protein [Actinomycetes bacterium]
MTFSRIAVEPSTSPQWVRDAVLAGGGEVVDISEATGLVWSAAYSIEALEDQLEKHPNINWVQLPFAGSEAFMHLVNHDRVWTCGKGVYAEPVAEHALGLLLAGFRHIGNYARQKGWTSPVGQNLLGANITILGGGGITTSLVRLLQPFACNITVVRLSAEPLEGVQTVVGPASLVDAIVGADAVVVALALTPDTIGILGRNEFELMERHAWVVNVGRGRHIVTDDLVWALQEGVIGGAALDVTNPEPLPEGHPLWSLPNCIITPHIGNTPAMAVPLLSARIIENVRHYVAGEPLVGCIDPELGY